MNETANSDTGARPSEHPIARLMRISELTQVPWIVEGLWQEGGIAIVHSLEEEFKSVFSYQIADAIAAGLPLLRTWSVPRPRRIGIFETEMDDLETGNRLRRMYPREAYPDGLIVSDNSVIQEFRRKPTLEGKFECVDRWMRLYRLEVLVWDTINSILATDNPNSECATSRFYDRLALLPHKGALLVRHDSKPSKDTEGRASNQLVRGSNRLVEDASLVIHLKRLDKAQNKVNLTVGKLRNGRKPDPWELWFDLDTFRLTPLPPVAAMLESGPQTRPELVKQGNERFGLKQRAIDDAIAELRPVLMDSREGHKVVYKLDPAATPDAGSPITRWWQLLERVETPAGGMQGCISSPSVSPPSDSPLTGQPSPRSKFQHSRVRKAVSK